MYTPIQPGIPYTLRNSVRYHEFTPHRLPPSLVYRFWTLETVAPLNHDFEYLVLPDGCIDIVFDLHDPPTIRGALIMTPHTTATRLTLKRSFRYAGIRLYPGAWHHNPVAVIEKSRTFTEIAGISMIDVQTQLRSTTQPEEHLEEISAILYQKGIIQPNLLIHSLLTEEWTTIEGASRRMGYSARHIQRVLLNSVGYKPHDFLKVIRFQRALSGQDFSQYADQSHYIREFKRITNMTPQSF